jgi:hypothetical protein
MVKRIAVLTALRKEAGNAKSESRTSDDIGCGATANG